MAVSTRAARGGRTVLRDGVDRRQPSRIGAVRSRIGLGSGWSRPAGSGGVRKGEASGRAVRTLPIARRLGEVGSLVLPDDQKLPTVAAAGQVRELPHAPRRPNGIRRPPPTLPPPPAQAGR